MIYTLSDIRNYRDLKNIANDDVVNTALLLADNYLRKFLCNGIYEMIEDEKNNGFPTMWVSNLYIGYLRELIIALVKMYLATILRSQVTDAGVGTYDSPNFSRNNVAFPLNLIVCNLEDIVYEKLLGYGYYVCKQCRAC